MTRKLDKPYYIINPDNRSLAAACELLNDPTGKNGILGPPKLRGRGFAHWNSRQLLRVEPKGKRERAPKDLEFLSQYFLVSERMKGVMETVAVGAVEFYGCDTVMRDGSPGAPYWACDVLPMLDVVDESRSNVIVAYENGMKRYSLVARPLHLRSDCVTPPIFRLELCHGFVLCTNAFARACADARLKGVRFSDIETGAIP